MRMLVTGQTQTGKTYYSHSIMAQYIKNNLRDRYVVTDKHDDQFEQHLKPLGFSKVTLDKYKPDTIDWYKVLQQEPKLFIHLHNLNNKQLVNHIQDLASDIQLLGNTFLVLDEAWEIWGVNKNLPEMESLIRAGEKTGICWIFITQQPIDVNMTLRKEAEIYTTFRISRGRHLDRIYTYFGEQDVIKEQVPELPDRHFFEYNAIKGTLRGPLSSEDRIMEV